MATLSNKINFRRGSTFSYTGLLALPLGSTWSIKSAVKDSEGKKVQDLICTIQLLAVPTPDHETHSILLESYASDTKLWPIDSLICDIEFTDNSVIPRVMNSGTFFINVQENITP